MKNYITLAFGLFFGLFAQMYAMEAPANRYLAIQNDTTDTLRLIVGLDDAPPIEVKVLTGQKTILPFNQSIRPFRIGSVGSISRQSVGFEAPDYSNEFASTIAESPSANILVIIKNPEQGFFGSIGSYFSSYRIQATPTKSETLLTEISGTKVLDEFPQAALVLRDHPDALVSVADVLGVDSQATPEMLKRVLAIRESQWQKLKQDSHGENRVFIDKILAILAKIKMILATKPEMIGRFFSEKTGIVPKDREQRKKMEFAIGKGLEETIKNSQLKELRLLLLEQPIASQQTRK